MTKKPEKLILHVGHGKTGSSALQSSLARSTANLLQHGIHYPLNDAAEKAQMGHITPGNIGRANLVDLIEEQMAVGGAETLLYSSESLFHKFAVDREFLRAVAAFGLQTTIILYVRNPIEHLLSVYGQSVKRQGYSGGPDSIEMGRTRVWELSKFLPNIAEVGFDAKIYNYSTHRDNLQACFEEALGVPVGTLVAPPSVQVNRSLTLAEAEIQRNFNRHYGDNSMRYLADEFCNKLPDIPPEPPAITRETYERMVAHFVDDVTHANSLLPDTAQLEITPFDLLPGNVAAEPDIYKFSAAQIGVLAQSLCAKMVDKDTTEEVIAILRRMKPGQPLTIEELITFLDLGIQLSPEIESLQRRRARLKERAGATA